MKEHALKQLQNELFTASVLYMDLSGAVCEILTESPAAPLTSADRARLIHLRRQEMSALKAYLSARLRLMTALSIETTREIRALYNAVPGPEPHPPARAQF
ncbi:MAG TPA: hypothetical protein VMB85_02160 [Bryobacteraceae bacterium]|jgi:hypothetical protein|nr:hypothetical protein [Bryobacteraceae bacterium]